MDRLDRSLDELISSTPRGGSGGRGGKRNRQEETRRGGEGRRSGGSAKSFQNSRAERITNTALPYQTNIVGPYHITTPQSTKTVIISRKPLARQVPQPVRPAVQNYFPPPQQTFVPPKHLPQEQSSQSSTIFDRIGSKPSSAKPDFISGTRVRISNLNPDITAGEVAELYGSIGEIKGAEMKFDRFGQSLGIVDLIFSRRSEGLAAITKFHGLTLDGSPMDVKLADEIHTVTPVSTTTLTSTNRVLGGPVASTSALQQPYRSHTGNTIVPATATATPAYGHQNNISFLNRMDTATASTSTTGKPVNVREGFFGTSMNDNDDDGEEVMEEEQEYYDDDEDVPVGYNSHKFSSQNQRTGSSKSNTTFSITLGNKSTNGTQGLGLGLGRNQPITAIAYEPRGGGVGSGSRGYQGRRTSGGSTGSAGGGGSTGGQRNNRNSGGRGKAGTARGVPLFDRSGKKGNRNGGGSGGASYGEGDLDAELDAYMTARS